MLWLQIYGSYDCILNAKLIHNCFIVILFVKVEILQNTNASNFIQSSNDLIIMNNNHNQMALSLFGSGIIAGTGITNKISNTKSNLFLQ